MHCPFCAHDDTKVNDSRLAAEGTQIRRRRECLACGERFTTFETAELVMPLVVKNDQRRVRNVQRPRRSVVAGAGLTDDQHRPVGAQKLLDRSLDLDYRRAGSERRERYPPRPLTGGRL